MDGYRKGTRKPKGIIGLREITILGVKIPPALAVASLLAALYVVFLFGSGRETGPDTLALSAFSTLSFAAFAYLAGRGSLAGLRPFVRLIDVFLVLSTLTFVWDLAIFFNAIDLNGYGRPMKPLLLSMAYAALTVVLIGFLLYHEKAGLKDAYARAGSAAEIARGATGGVAGLLLGLVAVYVLSGGSTPNVDMSLAGSVVAFSVISAAYVELLFRGLLLSRLVPLVGERSAVILQAVVFGVFEAAMLSAIGLPAIYAPVVFVAGSGLGYYWGRLTVKGGSILGPALFHAGVYAFIGLPLVAGMLPG